MKKRFLFISLALALALIIATPTLVLAAKPVPFNAGGTITYISPGTVFPAGQSGRWVVAERELDGTLGGDIAGDFALTYKANVESVYTQAGNIHGKLAVGQYVLNVTGNIPGAVFAGWYGSYPLYQLDISGKWTLISGAQGNGDFSAVVIFIPTPEGHVAAIVQSYISLTGKWQP